MRGYEYKVAKTPLHTETVSEKWKKRKKFKKGKNKQPKFQRPNYHEYIKSKRWYRRRRRIIRKRQVCEYCQSKNNLTVHHLTYKRLGRELEKDLVLLCWRCHEHQHEDKMAENHLKSIRQGYREGV